MTYINRRALAFLAVDSGLDSNGLGQLVCRHCYWSHGTECVRALAYVELFVVSLSFSRRHVVDNSISPVAGVSIVKGNIG
jgi:hypothetical protein